MSQLITSIIIALMMSTQSMEKPTLIYVGDPMCSWCYGISEQLATTIDHFEGKVKLDIVMGGLRAGGGDEWNAKFREFLKHHWEIVGTKTEQPFSYKILDKEYFNYDTEPSCRAVVSAMQLNPTIGFDFFKATQRGFYYENNDPKEVGFYKSICLDLDIDYYKFAKLFESEDMKSATRAHFRQAQELGIKSFPTVLLKKGDQTYTVAEGYATSAQMTSKINKLLQ